MRQRVTAEKGFLIGHIVSMVFGLAGLLLVLPNPEFIAQLPEIGLKAFGLSMAGGGVVYMLLGTIAVILYGLRILGAWQLLTFMASAVCLSLCSELLGTSTGFPFGEYHYLSGLGYKFGGLVPFTIPLSWFYLGCCTFLIARVGFESLAVPTWFRWFGAVTMGSVMLTSWDFVLDPAMSQTEVPFWLWDQPGAFFGMPYQNFAGWMGTGALFMTVASVLWQFRPVTLPVNRIGVPLAIYLANFGFAAIMSIAGGIYVPVLLGLFFGIGPVLLFYYLGNPGTFFPQGANSADVNMPVASVGAAQE
ncbi:MAG: gamma-carotene 1'-hydroxylase CruF [Cyanobacteria bacterium P01_H01_bin.15]